MKLSTPFDALERRFGLEKGMELVANAGFDAIDYYLGALTDDNSEYSGDGYREKAEYVKKLADKHSLSINQTHAPFLFPVARWNDPDEYENVIMPRFIRSIEISGIFGADVEVIHPLHHFVYLGHEEEIFEKNMEYYRRLIPYAKEYGVKIGVENMFQVDPRRKFIIADTCSNIPEFIRYIDTLNDDSIVACLDVGHIGLVQQKEESWDFVRALGHDRLKSLHIHDNDYRADLHQLPYMGKINWTEVTKALGEIDYTGDFTYETNFVVPSMDDDVVPIGMKYMVDIGRQLIKRIDDARPQK